MTDDQSPRKNTPDPNKAAAPKPVPGSDTKEPEGREPGKPLTKEEQMARYEEQLKEDDWGHQPC